MVFPGRSPPAIAAVSLSLNIGDDGCGVAKAGDMCAERRRLRAEPEGWNEGVSRSLFGQPTPTSSRRLFGLLAISPRLVWVKVWLSERGGTRSRLGGREGVVYGLVGFDDLPVIFEAALEHPKEAREAFLAEACPNNPEVAAQVRALLRADEAVGDDFLTLSSHFALVPEGALPERVGAYRILREIGRGGMGVVYEAEQANPRRRVALKVVRSSFDGEALRRRFEREAKVLGRLHHPGIAAIYEAGTAEVWGREEPYFAMELVNGPTLLDYLESRSTTERERLRLFVQICRAVEHAHQHGIIHRDLKPSNVLIAPSAGDQLGQVKVVDFGVARGERDLSTLYTRTGQIVGTLGYMSPEQLSGTAQVDARADVFALGVLLYWMLTGRLPYELQGKPLPEAVRVVQSEDPTGIATLNSRWRGDIATIVGTAIEREPSRRYPTARELADDVERHLAEQPIVARAPSRIYRTQKFVRRNRALVGGVLTTFLALVLGLVIALSALVTAQKKQAESEAMVAFLSELMSAASPDRLGREVKLLEVLESAEARIDVQLGTQPEVASRLYRVLAESYIEIGVYEPAEASAGRALEIAAELHGGTAPEALAARVLLAEAQYYAGRYPEAEANAQAVIRRLEAFGDHPFVLAQAYSILGTLRTKLGQLDEAELAFGRALGLLEAEGASDTLEGLEALSASAVVKTNREDYAAAEPLYREVIERGTQRYGADHPEVLLAMSNLGAQYRRTQRIEEAKAQFERALAGQRRVLGPANSKTLITLNNLAIAKYDLGEIDAALDLLEEGVATASTAYGAISPSHLNLLHSYGLLLSFAKRYDEAQRVLAENHRLHLQVHEPTDLPAIRAYRSRVLVNMDSGRLDDAVREGRALVELIDKVEIGASDRAFALAVLAEALIRSGRLDEAKPMVEAMEALGPERPRAKRVRALLDAASSSTTPAPR